MSLYLLINLLATFSALALNCLTFLSARVKVFIMLLALTSWIFPFQWLSELRPFNIYVPYLSDILPAIFSVITPYSLWESNVLLYTLLSIWSTVFLLLFSKDILKQKLETRRLMQQATDFESLLFNNKKITITYTSAIKGAMASGIFQHKIWLSNDLKDSKLKQGVLTHECVHIQKRDPLLLLITQFIKRLFWWNPLVLVIAKNLKQNIELRCDEICKIQLGRSRYQSYLAEFLLYSKRHSPSIFMPHFMSQDESFNIIRIKALDVSRSNTVVQKILRSFTLLIFSCLLIVSIFSGHTGLDGKRRNVIHPTSATTFDIRIEQMPLRSVGLTASLLGKTAYIHPDSLDELIYIELDDSSFNNFIRRLDSITNASIFIINNSLYIAPKTLTKNNNIAWAGDPKVSVFKANPPESQLKWNKNIRNLDISKKQDY